MNSFKEVFKIEDNKFFKIVDTVFLLGVVGVIAAQLYFTFLARKAEFENPKAIIEQYYGKDFITQYASRFTELKQFFSNSNYPARLTYFGEANEGFAPHFTHYILTQYYLAPNLVLKMDSGISDTLIYNLYNTQKLDPTTNVHLNSGYHIVKDFNNGYIILAK